MSTNIANATISNSTYQLFNTSNDINFRGDYIICNTTYCHVNCNQVGCGYATIFAETSNILIVECLGDSSCKYMTIMGSKSYLNIHCNDYYSCHGAKIYSETTTDISLLCENGWRSNTANKDYGACNNLQLFASETSLLEIGCYEYYSCSDVVINANISKSASIHYDSGQNANFKLRSTTSDANIDISCEPCSDSYWYLYGDVNSNGDKTNNLTVQCSYDGCKSAEFHVHDLHHAEIICDATESCLDAAFFTSTTEILDLSCNGNNACKSSLVHCPYHGEKCCIISCEQTGSCNNTQIYVPSSYIYGYLELSYPSNEIYPTHDACDGLSVNCYSNKLSADFVYNYAINEYECQFNEASYCCPDKPTESTTTTTIDNYATISVTTMVNDQKEESVTVTTLSIIIGILTVILCLCGVVLFYLYARKRNICLKSMENKGDDKGNMNLIQQSDDFDASLAVSRNNRL